MKKGGGGVRKGLVVHSVSCGFPHVIADEMPARRPQDVLPKDTKGGGMEGGRGGGDGGGWGWVESAAGGAKYSSCVA